VPDRFDKLPPEIQFETQYLEAVKVAAQGRLSAQMLHDAELRQSLDYMTDQMVFQLSSYVYGMKNEHQTQTVPYEKTIERTKHVTGTVEDSRKAGLIVFVVACLVAVLALPFSPIVSLVALGVITGAILSAVDVDRIPYEVDVDFSETVYGEIEIDAESWTIFPDNTQVFPREFGRPRTVVRYSAPRYFGER
jgi:hypothetical protein